MNRKVFFTIRFRILIAVLFLVTVVVTLITFTMANLFHRDKTAYIHDLTTLIAVHTAEEARSILLGYHERLRVFSRVLMERNIPQQAKGALLKDLFEDFQEFVAVTLYMDGAEKIRIFDPELLSKGGVSKADLVRYRKERPIPFDRVAGGEMVVENASLSENFPMVSLVVSQDHPGSKEAVVAAFIRLDHLLRIATRSKVFQTFLVDSEGTFLAHTERRQVGLRSKLENFSEIPVFQDQRSMGMSKEYRVGGVEVVGGFARVGFGGLMAGVQIPKTAAYLTARELLNDLVVMSLLLLVASAALGLFWSRKMTQPIEALSKATQDVGKGQFNVQVRPQSSDEIGRLAESFNHMTEELNVREEALKRTQTALIHSEKMAAFGQLGAGIAHEVKNPLAGILGYAQLSMRKVDENSAFYKNLKTIEKEAMRCKSIIESLMKFARQEKISFAPTNINRVVEEALSIMDHQLQMNRIKIEKALALDLPPISGNHNQIEQVLINLMINAQQAMEGRSGVVKVSTARTGPETVEIRIQDDGPGIPPEIREKIFDPFFTTKPTGKGTGLGLSVSYGIIKNHKGDINVVSEEGKGSVFVISFPVSEAVPSGKN